MRDMSVDLEGRSALVTGGGTGIGRAIALALGRCGADVTIGYHQSRDEAEHTLRELEGTGRNATVFRADITVEAEAERLVEHAATSFAGLDVVVANAGAPVGRGATAELTAEQWQEALALNCSSVFYTVKHAIPRLTDQRGRVIVTSSISARTGAGPGALGYAAAKGALTNMVRNWAKELAPRGITVNAIAPGIIRTRIHEQGTDPDEYQRLIARIPLGRDGVPEDCVGAVLLLASREGSFITGQSIEINGGMNMP